jgi:hypothetical protein
MLFSDRVRAYATVYFGNYCLIASMYRKYRGLLDYCLHVWKVVYEKWCRYRSERITSGIVDRCCSVLISSVHVTVLQAPATAAVLTTQEIPRRRAQQQYLPPSGIRVV